MEYVPEGILKKWRDALSTQESLKNKQVIEAINSLYNGVVSVDEAGKISIFKDMKNYLMISVPIEKELNNENGSLQTFKVKKPNCVISKEERENAISFLSATGKLMKLNQIILQKIFNVSQSTIAKDILYLKDTGRICPDFVTEKR